MEYVQNTAFQRPFLMVLASDHVTGAVGKFVTVQISKGGLQSFVPAQGLVTEVGNGFYTLGLTAADCNTVGSLSGHCTAAGCDPTDFVDQVFPKVPVQVNIPSQLITDVVFGGTGLAPTVSQILASARVDLNDTHLPNRYTDAQLLGFLNDSVLEIKRGRPDFFFGAAAVPQYSTLDVTNNVQFGFPLLAQLVARYVVGRAELRDDEFTEDSRAAQLLGLFSTGVRGNA